MDVENTSLSRLRFPFPSSTVMNLLMALLIELVMIPNMLKNPAITLLIP